MTLLAEKIQESVSALPSHKVPDPDVLFADVFALDAPQIVEALQDTAREAVKARVKAFRDALHAMRQKGVVGHISWKRNDVCAYDFYRARRCMASQTHHQTTTETTLHRNGNDFSEYLVTHKVQTYHKYDVIEHHRHDLFNAARHAYPAKTVRRPKFVEVFLPTIPDWLHAHIFLVEGEMLRETVEDQVVQVSSHSTAGVVSRVLIRTGRLYSPAITLHDFVLTGWSKADL